MKNLDLKVVEQVLNWIRQDKTVWLCTVLSTYGSSPREPGSWLAATDDGQSVGSLSGGCVEENFLERLIQGAFNQRISRTRYGSDDSDVALPCGGVLDVLIERLPPEPATLEHILALQEALRGGVPLCRLLDLKTGGWSLEPDDGLGERVEEDSDSTALKLRVGPVARLVIAGISPVSEYCAQFASSLGFEVIVCDPREDMTRQFNSENAQVEPVLPSVYLRRFGAHPATAVVALTHDPRIDDLALIEAIKTDAFYIGVMGSTKTSSKRAERLLRSGGLDQAQIDRIHMPIGLALGSKTPAEIALAVMADILRVRRGRKRNEL